MRSPATDPRDGDVIEVISDQAPGIGFAAVDIPGMEYMFRVIVSGPDKITFKLYGSGTFAWPYETWVHFMLNAKSVFHLHASDHMLNRENPHPFQGE